MADPRMVKTKGGGYHISEIERLEAEARDRAPAVTRCAHCPWSFEGTAGEGRAAAEQHRQEAHSANGKAHGVGSGASAHPWADALGEAAESGETVEIRLPEEPRPFQRKLIERLGGEIVIDPSAPGHCAHEPAEEGSPTMRKRWTKPSTIEAIKAFAAEHGLPPTAAEWEKSSDSHPSAYKVTALFGSWATGIEAAGFERPIRGRHRKKAEPKVRPTVKPAPADLLPPVPVPEPPPEPELVPPASPPPELRVALVGVLDALQVVLDAVRAQVEAGAR